MQRLNILHLFVAMSLISLISNAAPLQPGAKAPAVKANDDSGQEVDFTSVYDSGPTLVFFYPKADTPGCTAQACSLRDAFQDLDSKGLVILGVSRDQVENQKKFKEKFRLPFRLIADPDGHVAKAFGVPSVMGFTARQSFLVVDGKIVWHTGKAKTGDHVTEVQEALKVAMGPGNQ